MKLEILSEKEISISISINNRGICPLRKKYALNIENIDFG